MVGPASIFGNGKFKGVAMQCTGAYNKYSESSRNMRQVIRTTFMQLANRFRTRMELVSCWNFL